MNDNEKEIFHSKFITFEGTEGVGKTTQLQLLNEYLQSNNIQTVVTREPGGTKAGERIREILLAEDASPIDAVTELLLLFAARAQHLEEVIYPALRQNKWVLCDRFTDASYAYQGGGRGVSVSKIQNIESAVQGGFGPDLTLLLTGDIKKGMQRVSRRGKKDRFEKESLGFFARVQHAYVQRAKQHTARIAMIDADQEIAAVAVQIQARVSHQFPSMLA